MDWPVLDPATNKPYVDPTTGQPVLDPNTGRVPIDGGHAFNVAKPDPVNVWSIALDSKGKPL